MKTEWFALLSVLALTGGTSAFAQTPQNANGTLLGTVTTGNTVAASTFTQGSEGTTAQSSARFLNLAPDETAAPKWHSENGPSFGGETDRLGFGTTSSAYDHLYLSTVTADNVTLSGGGPAPVPEPGILVTVISLGFTTGVALLRGQNRASSHLPSHRLV